MDNLENNNINNTPPTEQNGSINGFDTVDNNPSQGTPLTPPVTPPIGYYQKSGSEIIQDDVTPAKSTDASADIGSTPPSDGTIKPPHIYAYPPPPRYAPPPVQPKKSDKKRHSTAVVIIAAVLAAVIGAVSSIVAITLSGGFKENTVLPTVPDVNEEQSQNSEEQQSSSNVTINIDESVQSVAQAVAQKATKSVVGIRTTKSVNSFFGGSSSSTGEGSGVIYTADGYIVTNYHVIEGAVTSSSSKSKIEVFFESSESKAYQAKVVGYNISADLAVIKVDATGLTPAQIGNSNELKVGQYVVTIGSPSGLEFMGSVTYGVISGLDRVVSSSSKIGLIQTDAAINPGNSGGALLDAQGNLIGINSSKVVAEEYEGMGFAIPINTVVEVCNKIITKKDNPAPYIGITISEKYTAEVLDRYGYPSGAVVLSVDDSSPAEDAGLRKGDIITEFNGTKISDYTQLGDLLAECEPNQSVTVKFYRSGKTYSTKIKVMSNN